MEIHEITSNRLGKKAGLLRHGARAAASVAAFVLLYIPLAGLIAALEGGVRGEWGLSRKDLVFQLSAFAVYFVPSLLILAPFAGVSVYATMCLLRRRSRSRPLAWAALLGPLVVFTVFFGLSVVVAIMTEAPWWWPVMFLRLPIAFVGGAAAYGVGVALIAGKEPRGYAA